VFPHRIDPEASPLHNHRKHDRPRSENVAPIQRDGHVGGIDAFDVTGHDDVGAQPFRLLQRPRRELVTGNGEPAYRVSSGSRLRLRPGFDSRQLHKKSRSSAAFFLSARLRINTAIHFRVYGPAPMRHLRLGAPEGSGAGGVGMGPGH